MRKIKQINLLQTKEKLNQRKTISQLESLNAEAEKCEKVSKELEEQNLDLFQVEQKLLKRLLFNYLREIQLIFIVIYSYIIKN